MAEDQESLEARREALRTFVLKELEGAGDYLQELGLLAPDAKAKGEWAITDVICISRFRSASRPDLCFWVLSGSDFPNDHTEAVNANDPREALRRFALSWHLQSERVRNLERSEDDQMDWQGASEELERQAERLHQLVNQADLWPERESPADGD